MISIYSWNKCSSKVMQYTVSINYYIIGFFMGLDQSILVRVVPHTTTKSYTSLQDQAGWSNQVFKKCQVR